MRWVGDRERVVMDGARGILSGVRGRGRGKGALSKDH